MFSTCVRRSTSSVEERSARRDQQIGALIATGDVDCLIFFVDPLTAMPHDVDVKALMRLAIVYDIPMALNRATAEQLIDFRRN